MPRGKANVTDSSGGAKKGKITAMVMRPEEVIDFMIRNYPMMHIELIKDSVLERLRDKEDNEERLKVLEVINIDGQKYYHDGRGNIVNCDIEMCGFVTGEATRSDTKENLKSKPYRVGITEDKKNLRVQMFSYERDTRTLKQVLREFDERE